MTWVLGLLLALSYLWWVQRSRAVALKPAASPEAIPLMTMVPDPLLDGPPIPEAIDVSLPLGVRPTPGGLFRCPICVGDARFVLTRYEREVDCSECGTRYRAEPDDRLTPLSDHPASEGLACPWCRTSVSNAVLFNHERTHQRCTCGLHYWMPLEQVWIRDRPPSEVGWYTCLLDDDSEIRLRWQPPDTLSRGRWACWEGDREVHGVVAWRAP